MDLQRNALLGEGIPAENIFSDVDSGKQADRLGWENFTSFLSEGDVLVCGWLDRIGRSLSCLIDIIENFNRKGFWFKIPEGRGNMIDTGNPEWSLVY